MPSHNSIQYMMDEPVRYKDLYIYPAKIRDYYMFMTLASCLFLERTGHTDPIVAVKAISMTYLDYLFYMSNDENQLIPLLYGLLGYVLADSVDKKILMTHRKNNSGKVELVINGNIYNSSDFDKMREIIAEQNLLELPDERIQKNVRDELEKAKRYKEKISGTGWKMADLEEQMVAVSLYSGWELNYVYNMTLRKFLMALKRANHIIMSTINLNASMSGFVKFKSKDALKGWLADLRDVDRYADVKMNPEDLQKKINFEEAMGK